MNYKKHNHKKVMKGKGRRKRINKRKPKQKQSFNNILRNSFYKKIKKKRDIL